MKILLIACLTVVMPGAGLAAGPSRSPLDEMRKSREELDELLTRYTEQHPLVLTKRERIAALKKSP